MFVLRDVKFTKGRRGAHGESLDLDLYIPRKVRDSDSAVKDTKEVNKIDWLEEYCTNSAEELEKSDTSYGVTSDMVCTRCSDREHELAITNLRAARKVPCVLFIHGGGWRRGGKEAWRHYVYWDVNLFVATFLRFFNVFNNVGESFASNGIACAIINYPLTELGFPLILVEILMSYLCSCLLIFVFLIAGLGFIIVYDSILHTYRVMSISENPSLITLIFTIFQASGLVTNICILSLFTIKRRNYNFSTLYVLRLWGTVFIFTLLPVINGLNSLLLMNVITFIVTQGSILRKRLQRRDVSYVDQAGVVAEALRWVRRFGVTTGQLDPDQLFLAGHSAGGHLAALVTLDRSYLRKVGLGTGHLRGVISISGVYDLHCLNIPILRPLYLHPTFGKDPDAWAAASPQHHLQHHRSLNYDLLASHQCSIGDRVVAMDMHHCCHDQTQSPIEDGHQITSFRMHKGNSSCVSYEGIKVKRSFPKFLILSAQNDVHLKKQADRFVSTLSDKGILCSNHMVINGTNHFSIVAYFDRIFGNDSVLGHCIKFIVDDS
ncbi:hypothetical protein CHS0354_027686 [Potamilus streckersoni]|uniref:Uncharacterized protein n=1 Tax=Potamilus streckersoni TaxID=2493646 RepID=A0AAE0W4T4_9BIVA|nr:hypothetical protein CHS0354_027686 [Potamilus streckersoni]